MNAFTIAGLSPHPGVGCFLTNLHHAHQGLRRLGPVPLKALEKTGTEGLGKWLRDIQGNVEIATRRYRLKAITEYVDLRRMMT